MSEAVEQSLFSVILLLCKWNARRQEGWRNALAQLEGEIRCPSDFSVRQGVFVSYMPFYASQ